MAILSFAPRDPAYVTYGLFDIALGVVNLAVCGGTILVLRGSSTTMAWATSIAATIPCISPCVVLGAPLGIWMMMVLLQHKRQTQT